MARFTEPFRRPRVVLLLSPGLKTLAAVVAVAVLLTVGQVTLQARMVEAQIAQAELQAQAEQARVELQAEMEQARIEAQLQAQNVESDRAALTALFNSTGGSGWTNANQWNTSGPLSDWHGVSTNAGGRVVRISLPNNNLTGTLPAELGNLSDLTTLTLYTNNLTGPIPPELGDLSNLVDLSLYGNDLTGSIPPELGQLSSLRSMLIYNNSLTGRIPPELGDLTPRQVVSMDFSGNQLTGQLPYGFTRLTQVNFLRFHDNAGLCAPLDSDFQAWLDGVDSNLQGDNCPRTRIHSGHNPPLLNEPVTALLTTREHRLARIQATLEAYETNSCIGYDASGDRADLDVPVWTWERADADSNDPNAPDDSTWASVADGRHPNATFVYLPQSGDVGKFLRASLTHGSPEQTDTTDPIGPVTDSSLLLPSPAVPFITGTAVVGNVLGLTIPDSVESERHDPAINPRPEVWQWETAPSGGVAWVNVTSYHLHCEQPDTEYTLTAADEGKNVRAYIYYNDDGSGSIVRNKANTPRYGPVDP